MKHWLVGLAGWAALFLLFSFLTVQAQQPPCFARAPFIAMLHTQYGEVVLWEALMEPEHGKAVPIIMFAAPLGRTWTLASNVNPAMLCPFLKGSAFEPPSPDGKGDKEAPPT